MTKMPMEQPTCQSQDEGQTVVVVVVVVVEGHLTGASHDENEVVLQGEDACRAFELVGLHLA